MAELSGQLSILSQPTLPFCMRDLHMQNTHTHTHILCMVRPVCHVCPVYQIHPIFLSCTSLHSYRLVNHVTISSILTKVLQCLRLELSCACAPCTRLYISHRNHAARCRCVSEMSCLCVLRCTTTMCVADIPLDLILMIRPYFRSIIY